MFNGKDGQGEWNRTWAPIFDPPPDHSLAEAFEVDEDAGPAIAIAQPGGAGVAESTIDRV